MSNRHGILAGGNFILDRVKIIDHFPAEEMLATILSETASNGGGPYNVLKDLSRLECGFPLAAVGLVGTDHAGDLIFEDCRSAGIDTQLLHRTSAEPTSYTDAMTVAETGKRTFFHHRGTNALLDVEHFDFRNTSAKFFYLGYLNLLDRLDAVEGERSRASLVLESAKEAGLATCVDLVSIDSVRFQQVVRAAIPWTDQLFANETEAGKTLGIDVPSDDPEALSSAAKQLVAAGVQQTAIVHSRFGAAAASVDGSAHYQPALELDADHPLRGANGAGDAFAAGYLCALHANQSLEQRLLLGVCAAAMSLTDPTPSGGVQPVRACLALAD